MPSTNGSSCPNCGRPYGNDEDAGDDDADARLARAEWNGSAALRTEFSGNFGSYVAYKRAAANGQVKILGGRRNV